MLQELGELCHTEPLGAFVVVTIGIAILSVGVLFVLSLPLQSLLFFGIVGFIGGIVRFLAKAYTRE